MLLRAAEREIVEGLRTLPDVDVIEDLDFRRAHIRDGKVMIADMCLSDLDAYFWFGEVTREYDSFDLHILEAISRTTAAINSGTALRIALDKLLTQLHLHKADVPVPPFLVVSRENVEDVRPIVERRQYIAKPRLGSFGVGITRVNDHEQLVDLVDYSQSMVHFLEEMIDAGPDGFIGINVIGGRVVAGYSKDASKYRGWKVFDRQRCGGGMHPKVPTDEQARIALRVAEAIGLDICGVDILTGKDGQHYVIDVNPFPGLYPNLDGMNDLKVADLVVRLIASKLSKSEDNAARKPALSPAAS